MPKTLLRFLTKVRTSRLQDKFTLFFIVLAAVPALVLGGVAVFLIDFSHRYDVSSLELQLLGQKEEEIEKFLANTLEVLNLKVGIARSEELESSDRPWQDVLAKQILESNTAFDEISFVDLQGKERARRARARTFEKDELSSVYSIPYFSEVAAGKIYIGQVYFTLSGPKLTLAAPVRVGEQVIQIISAEVSLNQLVRSFSSARVGSSGYLVLLSSDGRVIASGLGDQSRVRSLRGWERVENLLSGVKSDALGSADRYLSPIGSQAVVGAGGKNSKTGWILMVEWPLEDADAVIRDVRDQVIWLTLFSVLAVVVISPLFAKRLIRPIRALEYNAREVERGNFSVRVDIATHDELEELGAAFNRMTQGLKRLQELKNEFVFIAAHELRTLVTAIRGYLSMVREGSAGVSWGALSKDLDPVWQASDRLNHLVNDILEIARSEAGKMKVEVSEVDLAESILSVLAEVRPMAEAKGITLFYDPAPEKLKVKADSLRLREVLANFLSNAVKYNHANGWVRVRCEERGQDIIVNIEDNGFGVSGEDQKHLFEKFFRAENEETKSVSGTGLGLFITKELIEKMGGKVWVVSVKGQGTTFSFSLPR